ncbi:MAG: flagellar hook-basal body complex protein FliE [Actinomycetota bacterium]
MTPLAPISSVGLLPVGPAPAAAATAAPAASSDAFAGLLSRAVGSLNDQLTRADSLQQAAATGALPDPTVAIVEVEKADIALQLATQVRNKLVEGWQELSRMSV